MYKHSVYIWQGLNTAEIGLGGWNTWIETDNIEDDDEDMMEEGNAEKEHQMHGS